MEKGNRVFMKQYFNSVLKGYPFRGKYDQDFLTLKNWATFFFFESGTGVCETAPKSQSYYIV